MENFLGGFILPLLLLTASLLNWSLISLIDLLAFLIIRFTFQKIGFRFRRQTLITWGIIIFSLLTLISHAVYHIIRIVEGEKWNPVDSWWAQLVGFVSVQTWRTPSVVWFLVVQILSAFAALVDVYWSRFDLVRFQTASWEHLLSSFDNLGSHVRVACCLMLPAVQLVVGISHPSWISLPFFLCSCVGLVDWSLTSNFLGLFRWWRLLLLYAGFNILVLYVYQLPIELPNVLHTAAHFIGLFKLSAASEWPEISSALSLILFYFMLSSVKLDLEEMDFIISMRQSSLTEQLLPSRHSFFIRESRSGVRHTNVLLTGAVFRTFSINFFTYGFPVGIPSSQNYVSFRVLVFSGLSILLSYSVTPMRNLNGTANGGPYLLQVISWGLQIISAILFAEITRVDAGVLVTYIL